MISLIGVAGVVHRAEDRPHRAVVLRVGRQADPDLGDDRQRAFAARPARRSDPVRPGSLDRPSCTIEPSPSTASRPENVVDGDAVLERVRAAGIGGHVAADGAGHLARRIGGEMEPAAGQGLAQPEVGTPASTTATRLRRSISRILSMRASETTTAPA